MSTCNHVRQVVRISMMDGIAEFDQEAILPCADPECPNTWPDEAMTVRRNDGLRHDYERWQSWLGWRWIRSGDRSIAEEREACAKIADRHPNGRDRGCQCNACKSGREIRARAGAVVDEAAVWRERALKAEAQLQAQRGICPGSPAADMDEEGPR